MTRIDQNLGMRHRGGSPEGRQSGVTMLPCESRRSIRVRPQAG